MTQKLPEPNRVLMVATITEIKLPPPEEISRLCGCTRFITATESRSSAHEPLCRAYDETIHALFHDKELGFHRHHVHAQALQKADWIATAFNQQEDPVAFALIVSLGEKWVLEYVMTHPDFRSSGLGRQVMWRILYEAWERKIPWVILNCTIQDEGERRALAPYYADFGFRAVAY